MWMVEIRFRLNGSRGRGWTFEGEVSLVVRMLWKVCRKMEFEVRNYLSRVQWVSGVGEMRFICTVWTRERCGWEGLRV